MTKHPYDILPALEELSTATDPERQRHLRRLVAANLGDQETLQRLLGLSSLDGSSFYPDQLPPELSTADTIDAFLERFGSDSSAAMEPPGMAGPKNEGPVNQPNGEDSNQPSASGVNQPPASGNGGGEPVVPVAPAVDYLTLLAMEEGAPAPHGGDTGSLGAIAAGINASAHHVEEEEDQDNDGEFGESPAELEAGDSDADGEASSVDGRQTANPSGSLSESFAKMLIENGNYGQAYEILETMSLKNPEKSIYFADQLRFLRKLMLLTGQSGGRKG